MSPSPTHPPPGRPRRRRPSAWWFAVGGGMIIAGLAVFVGLLVVSVRNFSEIDVEVPADRQEHLVRLDDLAEQRMVWARSAESADCTIVDRASGEEVDYSPLTASYEKSTGDESYVGVVAFDPGSGDLSVSCQDSLSPVQIGPKPHLAEFAGGILGGIAALVVLLGGGVVVLIVVTVLFVTGEPRRLPEQA